MASKLTKKEQKVRDSVKTGKWANAPKSEKLAFQKAAKANITRRKQSQ